MYTYVDGNPTVGVDPYGLFTWDDPSTYPLLPRSFVNASAGVGDALLLGQGQRLRNLLGIGGINTCSSSYGVGTAVGIIGSLGDGEGEMIAGREAATLAEQLAMEEAMGGAGERIMEGEINDPRYPEDIWKKVQWVHEDLTTGENIVIHYWRHIETGAMHGFKFK